MESDEQLVKRFQRGDPDAFAQFTERHRDRLYRMSWAWLGESALAEDAVQETFLRTYTGIGRFRFRAAATTWLVRVCRNVCSELARKHPRGDVPEPVDVADDENSADPTLPHFLQAMLRELPQRQREVVVLRLLEDCSVRDTAVIMGCREGTVKAHLARAVTNMRAILEAQGIDPREVLE